MDSHLREKDFWTTVIAFTSKDDNLNKAHVRYLEARLLQLAKEADRAALKNGNGPAVPRLSEADQADMEGYLEEMLTILPLLGVSAFEALERQAEPQDQLRLSARKPRPPGRTPPTDSSSSRAPLARASEVPSIHGYLSDLRAKLVADGVLAPEGIHLRFTKPYAFDSPSTAAGVVLGRAANGRVEWKDAAGVTLKQRQIAAITGPP